MSELAPIEDQLLRTSIFRQRDALQAMGIALTERSFGAADPRRGVMSV